ncbi:MAG: transglutaminase-like domain-containing protein [Bacteroidota bacterium]
MKKAEIKALVKLLDDEDHEVIAHIEEKIMSLGTQIIPALEEEWEVTFNPIIQGKIEDLVHELQFELLKERLISWKKEENDDLLKGLWILASYQYPDLDLSELRYEIEQLYIEMWRQLQNDMSPIDQVQTINEIFFNQFKFRSNTRNFHSPANSMINAVIESKKGNPISLCSIYMLLAQKMNLPVYGVNLPNLFILTYQIGEKSFYINVFNRGLIFTKNDIDNYLENLQLSKQKIFYEACTNIDILMRSMRNLVVSFDKLGDYHKSDEIKILLESLQRD